MVLTFECDFHAKNKYRLVNERLMFILSIKFERPVKHLLSVLLVIRFKKPI